MVGKLVLELYETHLHVLKTCIVLKNKVEGKN